MKQTKQQERAARRQEICNTARAYQMDRLNGSELVELLAKSDDQTEWAASDTLVSRGSGAVPALLTGLSHPDDKIRAACALLLDHVADDRCVEPLLQVIRYDPIESVRRCALHSLVCDGCKECPLNTDVASALMEVALKDRAVSVRRRAVFYLSMQRPNARIASFLQNLLMQETDSILLRRAQRALRQHQVV